LTQSLALMMLIKKLGVTAGEGQGSLLLATDAGSPSGGEGGAAHDSELG
jgi:hypothetical protein